jgi:CheY-like chemotaxis protein
VDDDPAVRTVAAGMLRDLGCQVTEARDGEEAIAELRRAQDHTAAAPDRFRDAGPQRRRDGRGAPPRAT